MDLFHGKLIVAYLVETTCATRLKKILNEIVTFITRKNVSHESVLYKHKHKHSPLLLPHPNRCPNNVCSNLVETNSIQTRPIYIYKYTSWVYPALPG